MTVSHQHRINTVQRSDKLWLLASTPIVITTPHPPISACHLVVSLLSLDHLAVLSYYLAPTKYSFPQAASVIALCSKASCGLLHPNHPPHPLSHSLSQSRRLKWIMCQSLSYVFFFFLKICSTGDTEESDWSYYASLFSF